MASRNDGSGSGLLEFLDWAGRTGQMNATTARAWAASTRQVLAIDETPEATDVRSLDVEEHLARFETLHRLDYSPSSMTTYKSRFRSAVDAYRSWLNNEPWKPTARGGRGKASAKNAGAKTGPPAPASESLAATATDVPAPDHGVVPRLLNYTVPLRPDLMVTMSLPVDLSSADAKRITAFVQSLAFDHEPPAKSAPETALRGG